MTSIRWLVLALVCSLVVPAAMGAALVTKGSHEIELSGRLDFATEVGTEFELGVNYAYFFWDRISLGVRGGVGDNDAVTYTGIGLTGEYNFALPANWRPLFGTDLVPYLGAAVDYRHAQLFDETEDAAIYGGEAGVKFFLTDSTAINLSLVGEWATADIYADDLEATDLNLYLLLGMRFYF
jgi:outer membrane protein W